MSRVPDHPPKPLRPVVTLQDYIDAGLIVSSFCSTRQGHSHVVDLVALAADRGPGTVIDYALKRSLICPECGAAGGGLEIRSFLGGGAKRHPLSPRGERLRVTAFWESAAAKEGAASSLSGFQDPA